MFRVIDEEGPEGTNFDNIMRVGDGNFVITKGLATRVDETFRRWVHTQFPDCGTAALHNLDRRAFTNHLRDISPLWGLKTAKVLTDYIWWKYSGPGSEQVIYPLPHGESHRLRTPLPADVPHGGAILSLTLGLEYGWCRNVILHYNVRPGDRPDTLKVLEELYSFAQSHECSWVISSSNRFKIQAVSHQDVPSMSVGDIVVVQSNLDPLMGQVQTVWKVAIDGFVQMAAPLRIHQDSAGRWVIADG